jgi:hypothetical protein
MQQKNLAGWVMRWECHCLRSFALCLPLVGRELLPPRLGRAPEVVNEPAFDTRLSDGPGRDSPKPLDPSPAGGTRTSLTYGPPPLADLFQFWDQTDKEAGPYNYSNGRILNEHERHRIALRVTFLNIHSRYRAIWYFRTVVRSFVLLSLGLQ